MALIVEKSKACLTAIAIATNPQTPITKEITPPRKGIKLKMSKIPGASEKPIVRRSSLYVAMPPKTFVPMIYVMKDQINHPTSDKMRPVIKLAKIIEGATPSMAMLIALPIPEQTLAITTIKRAWGVAVSSVSTSSYKVGSSLAARIILSTILVDVGGSGVWISSCFSIGSPQ